MRTSKRLFAACAFFIGSALTGYAGQFGDFTYVEYVRNIEITDYPEDATGDVIIPSEIVGKPVNIIGQRAFRSCRSLTSVTIPDSVTHIGEWAFAECSSLTSVTIPDSVTGIGEWAFVSCTSLTSVLISNNVTRIGYRVFLGCSKLTNVTIPDSVTSIGAAAFQGCSRLTSVTIPDSITSIGDHAFSTCIRLTNVTIPDSVTSIGYGAFSYCHRLTSLTIPDSVTSIGYGAFSGHSNLMAITVDTTNPSYSSVDGVLFDKSQTTLLQFPGGKAGIYTIPDSVTRIGDHAFSHCYGLTSVTIGSGVTSIGDFAFGFCSGLTNVKFPDSVTSIGHHSFEYCSSLTSLTIGSGVTSIGQWAFSRCENLTSMYYAENAPIVGWRVFAGSDNVFVYYLPGTTGWGTTFGDRPAKEISILPDPLIGGTPINGYEGWFLSEWFGIYYTPFAPWLFHAEHGLVFRSPGSSNASTYFYDNAMGAWWWTNQTFYPFIYAFNPPADNAGTDIGSAWLFFFEESNDPRVFGVVTGDQAGSLLFFNP